METVEQWHEKFGTKNGDYDLITNRLYDATKDVDFFSADETWFGSYVDISPNSINFFNNYKCHRIDGPAQIYYSNGSLYNIWYFNQNEVAIKIEDDGPWMGVLARWAVEQNIDLDNLSDEDKTMIKLVWG